MMAGRILTVVCLLALTLAVAGGATRGTENRDLLETVRTEKMSDVTVSRGEIYELTENNFVKGLDHRFTEEEIGFWNRLLSSVPVTGGRISKKDLKYIIHLYDAEGNELFDFGANTDFSVYSEWGRLDSTELTEFLRTLAEQG